MSDMSGRATLSSDTQPWKTNVPREETLSSRMLLSAAHDLNAYESTVVSVSGMFISVSLLQ